MHLDILLPQQAKGFIFISKTLPKSLISPLEHISIVISLKYHYLIHYDHDIGLVPFTL